MQDRNRMYKNDSGDIFFSRIGQEGSLNLEMMPNSEGGSRVKPTIVNAAQALHITSEVVKARLDAGENVDWV